MPDNISANPPSVISRPGLHLCAINPVPSSLSITDTGICAGYMLEPFGEWWKPSSPIPDGAYAIFRSDDRTVELVSDITGSRTIWYIRTDTMFIASTSQQAIVYFLRSFECNTQAVVWMLASGNIGPWNSWDSRIRMLTSDSVLRFDRETWKMTVDEREVHFYCENKTEKKYELELREAIEYSVKYLPLEGIEWRLLLSGGFDSRAVLLNLLQHKDIRCIIFGMRSEFKDSFSDTVVARRLAEYLELDYQYFELEPSDEPVETVIDRFILTGEGRSDNISHYLDGLAIWKCVFESGIAGVVKADEVLGAGHVYSDLQARQRQEAWFLEDYCNMGTIKKLVTASLGRQTFPLHFNRKGKETLPGYCNRLYQAQVPVVFTAWNEPRFPYVEVWNPLLTRRIVSVARSMPDSLSVNKSLFRKIVAADSPDIPFARHGLGKPEKDIFTSSEYRELLYDTLGSSFFRDLFSGDLVDCVLEKVGMEIEGHLYGSSHFRNRIQVLLPENIRYFLRAHYIKLRMSYVKLAFRMLLAGKTAQMLTRIAGSSNRS